MGLFAESVQDERSRKQIVLLMSTLCSQIMSPTSSMLEHISKVKSMAH